MSVADEPMTVVFELSGAGFAAHGVELCGPLSARSEARCLGLVGDFDPLFRVLTQDAELSAGQATLAGSSLERALADGVASVALCDPPLDPRLDVLEHLTLAGRLSARSRREARADAAHSLEQLGLSPLAKHPLGSLSRLQTRAVGCAQATLGAPRVVCLQTPFAGLDAVSADRLRELLASVAERHALLFSLRELPALGPERCALDGCDAILVLRDGALRALELTRELPTRYRVRATGNLSELRAGLEAAGCGLSAAPAHDVAATPALLVELPAGANSGLLFAQAREHGATLLEVEGLES
jgi:ABC-type multidrug transport system ATPase subunit